MNAYWVEACETWLELVVDGDLQPEQVTALVWSLGIDLPVTQVGAWVELVERAQALEADPDSEFCAAAEDSDSMHVNGTPADRFDWAMSQASDAREEARRIVVNAVVSRSMQLVV